VKRDLFIHTADEYSKIYNRIDETAMFWAGLATDCLTPKVESERTSREKASGGPTVMTLGS
jgi:hypothetical protein